MLDSHSSIADILGFDGPFSHHLHGFAPRLEQQRLAEAVFDCIENHSVLLGEAGTGIGKTFAYLVPAVLSGQRVIISTGTKHLQDQLFKNDVPLVKRAIAPTLQARLLKGRANYLCQHRLARAMGNSALRRPDLQRHLHIIHTWAKQTQSGDMAEVLDVPEDSPVWSYVNSTEDFCSKHEYEELDGCFVSKARKEAQEADIIVVNHHLLCADLALKEQGFGELLPSAQSFIIDEAHQLTDVATSFFGQKISSRQLFDLARDTLGEQLHEAPDMKELRELSDKLDIAVKHFRLAFGVDPDKQAWVDVSEEEEVQEKYTELESALQDLIDVLDIASERGKGLDSCHKRAIVIKSALKQFKQQSQKHSFIYWYETFRTGFMLNMTPLDVAEPFQKAMKAIPASWIFTSATLTVGGDFSHFKAGLGLRSGQEIMLDSPFNYRDNAILYLPTGLPDPSSADFTLSVMEKILPVLEASRGRAFLLFTSYRAMNAAEKYLQDHGEFTLLVQQTMPKRELVEAFQSVENAVLLGTSSFWEGVDVRGSALSCVIIEKLPFASPGDPVMKARIQHTRDQGENPFFEYQLPQAAIALKQGAGRLIRGVEDQGVLVLCDPRVQTRNYGEVFINSLPPMPITREVEEIISFFENKCD